VLTEVSLTEVEELVVELEVDSVVELSVVPPDPSPAPPPPDAGRVNF
jgi:hypothetical protein